MKPALKWLILLILILALLAALAGVWPAAGTPYPLTSFRGEEVTINARGLYTWDTVSSAAQMQANDLVMLVLGLPLLALSSPDGLYSRCSGNPEVPRWLGRMAVSDAKPQQQAGADTEKLRSSPGAVVVASNGDDKSAWVRTGQVYERLALQMTALDIKSAFLNQPIEMAELRSQFQSALGLGQAVPQLLARYGYATALPRSLRRPVAQVLI